MSVRLRKVICLLRGHDRLYVARVRGGLLTISAWVLGGIPMAPPRPAHHLTGQIGDFAGIPWFGPYCRRCERGAIRDIERRLREGSLR